jgi:alkyldihydroxyacetonephosphate synthase
MSGKRRSFFGWGYEGEAVAAEELAWFERAWAQLFGVDGFDPVPLPRAQEIVLRPPRVSAPAALEAFCTAEK